MLLNVVERVFEPDKLGACGAGILSLADLPGKIPLRNLIFARNEALANIGRFLLLHFWQSPLPDRYAAATGEEPLLLLHICTLRVQEPSTTANYVPWHLDANFFGFDTPLWTVWVPFVDVGTEAVGLEFSLPVDGVIDERHVEAYWRLRQPNEHGQTVIGEADRADFHGERAFTTIAPPLRVGGAFVFDQYVLHRTQVAPRASRRRVAIEYRISPRSRFPCDVDFQSRRDFLVAVREPGDRIAIRKLHEHFAQRTAS
jgi:hypothetical protein